MFRDHTALGKCIYALAKWTAVAGGAMLLAVTVLICVSVTGRALLWAGLRPVPGDYELVSIGIGFAIFAFMPWAHLTRAHALVTLLTDRFGARANRLILIATDLMMLVAAAFIAWRLQVGMLDKFAYRETTLLLRFPLGWAYAAGLAGAVILVIVAVYVLGRSIEEAAARSADPRGDAA